MKFENKIRLRAIMRDIAEIRRKLRAFDFQSASNRLDHVEGKLGIFAEKVRLNEISEEEEE